MRAIQYVRYRARRRERTAPQCINSIWPPRPPHSGEHLFHPLKMRTAALWRPSRSRGLAKFVLLIHFIYVSIYNLWIAPPRSIAGGCIQTFLQIFPSAPARASGFAPAAARFARSILRGPGFLRFTKSLSSISERPFPSARLIAIPVCGGIQHRYEWEKAS